MPFEPVHFIFDQHPEYSGMMATVYQWMRKDLGYPDWMGSTTFQDRRKFVPLQAADLLAYEMFKHLGHRAAEPWRKNRKSLSALNTGWYSLKRLDRDTIRCYAEGFFSKRELE